MFNSEKYFKDKFFNIRLKKDYYDLQQEFLSYISSKECKTIVSNCKIVIEEKEKKTNEQKLLDYLNSVKGLQGGNVTINGNKVVQTKRDNLTWLPYFVLNSKIIPNYIPIAYR